jgi:putative membrane protein
MRRRFLIILGVLVALGVAGCGAPSTPEFVERAAQHDLYQAEAGKIASEKGRSDKVKEFGRRMAEEGGKTSEELKTIVEAEKLKIAVPGALTNKYRRMLETLSNAKPEDFDQVYAQQQVDTLKRAVELYDGYAEAGQNEALKQFAANVLPDLKRNRDRVKTLLK